MKKLLIMFAIVATAFGASAKESNDTTVCFRINPPMSCVNCENKIKTNLRFEKGVTAIEATAPGDVVNIRFNKTKTDELKLVKAFDKIGYKAQASAACTARSKACTDGAKTCCGGANANGKKDCEKCNHSDKK